MIWRVCKIGLDKFRDSAKGGIWFFGYIVLMQATDSRRVETPDGTREAYMQASPARQVKTPDTTRDAYVQASPACQVET